MLSTDLFPSELADRVLKSQNVAVLTGAGISAESGVPTFRGENGIWKKIKPEKLASMEAFLNDPDLVWEWYNFRRGLLRRVEPNDGHLVLAKMEKYYRNFLVSTQNVDGLHQRAGSGNVRELHGNILNSKCAKCNKPYENDEPIKCECGGLVRPDVVWFGEYLPENALEDSFKAAMDADLYLSIGTSANVYPAALLPMEAKNHGAYVIEINLEQTPLSNQVDFSIQDYSGNVLTKLWSIIDREGK